MVDRVFLASTGGDYFSETLEVGEKNRGFKVDDDSYILKAPYYYITVELLFKILEGAISSGWVEIHDDGDGQVSIEERDRE